MDMRSSLERQVSDGELEDHTGLLFCNGLLTSRCTTRSLYSGCSFDMAFIAYCSPVLMQVACHPHASWLASKA